MLPWSRSRLAIRACSASADDNAATLPAPSGSIPATSSFSAAARGLPSTASIGSMPEHRPCSGRGDGSISLCAGLQLPQPSGPADKCPLQRLHTMRNRRFRSITAGAGLAVLLLSLVLATPSRAAEPAFPPGSRIGLVPPTGMVISDAFAGFADPEKNAAILIATLPAAAYSQLDKTLDTEELRKQGITLEKREPMRLDAGKGFLLTGRQVAGKERYRKWLLVLASGDITALVSVQVPESDTAYPNNIVRTALATLAVRQKVPEQEQLGLLPFTGRRPRRLPRRRRPSRPRPGLERGRRGNAERHFQGNPRKHRKSPRKQRTPRKLRKTLPRRHRKSPRTRRTPRTVRKRPPKKRRKHPRKRRTPRKLRKTLPRRQPLAVSTRGC